MQEGVLSLLQMAKTVTAANRLRDKQIPFIVVLSNPSTGQAYASFANLADVIPCRTRLPDRVGAYENSERRIAQACPARRPHRRGPHERAVS